MKTIRRFASLVMLASFPEARNVQASASGICRDEAGAVVPGSSILLGGAEIERRTGEAGGVSMECSRKVSRFGFFWRGQSGAW